jgi:hypothetical protein
MNLSEGRKSRVVRGVKVVPVATLYKQHVSRVAASPAAVAK